MATGISRTADAPTCWQYHHKANSTSTAAATAAAHLTYYLRCTWSLSKTWHTFFGQRLTATTSSRNHLCRQRRTWHMAHGTQLQLLAPVKRLAELRKIRGKSLPAARCSLLLCFHRHSKAIFNWESFAAKDCKFETSSETDAHLSSRSAPPHPGTPRCNPLTACRVFSFDREPDSDFPLANQAELLPIRFVRPYRKRFHIANLNSYLVDTPRKRFDTKCVYTKYEILRVLKVIGHFQKMWQTISKLFSKFFSLYARYLVVREACGNLK